MRGGWIVSGTVEGEARVTPREMGTQETLPLER